MTCRFMHKLCKSDCDNHVCRAYFPEKQPYIAKHGKDICMGDDYETECLIYAPAVKWREERRLKGLTVKCPLATNTRCGRPWEWWCKGGNYPFLLTTYEIREGTDDIPVRDSEGVIKFTHDQELISNTCLSGDAGIYTECPNYKVGMALREAAKNKSLKSKESHE